MMRRPGFSRPSYFRAAHGGDSAHLQVNRPGREAHAEFVPLSPALDSPQEKEEIITRWGSAAPHLGQTIFKSFSDAPWIISNRLGHLQH
jgi:hypothetical protein